MFLNQLLEKEKIAFLELAQVVAWVDDEFTAEEEALLNLYKQEVGVAQDFLIQKHSLQEILAHFSSETSKNIAFIEVLAVVFSDGVYSDEEKAIIKEIQQAFGFSNEKYEKYKSWIQKINNVYSEGAQLIYG